MQTIKDIASFLALFAFLSLLMGAGIIIADRQSVHVAEVAR